MKAAWRAADRAAHVLAAARGWRAAGLIDEPTLAAIDADHPATGPRLGPLWRALIFVCVIVGASTATVAGFFMLDMRSGLGVGLTMLFFGVALAVVTDLVVDRYSFQPTGAEAATSLLAAGYLCIGAYLLLDDHFHLHEPQTPRLIYAWCVAVFGLAAWRWGFRLYAGAAVGFALLLAAWVPGARIGWVAVAALVVLWASARLAGDELAPSHRGGVETARVVALAAIYVAVNYYSVDKGFLEDLGRAFGGGRYHPEGISLLLAGAGSALYPIALLWWGVRTRDRVVIVLGILTAALSLTTIRFYVHVAPLWVVLAGSGAMIAGASLLLEHWLRSGRGGERAGFTAAPLYDEGRRERLLSVAAALSQSPEARALPVERPGVVGGGGGFGGGGAGGTF